MKMKKKKEILLFISASRGGHLTQAMALLGDLPGCRIVVFSEETPRLKNLPCQVYSYRTREGALWKTIHSFFHLFFRILQTRPDWVVTTGAECGAAAVIAGKLLFRKTIFIETASRYRTKTMAARISYPLVDRFFVQHRESLKIYGKKAEYIGGVL